MNTHYLRLIKYSFLIVVSCLLLACGEANDTVELNEEALADEIPFAYVQRTITDSVSKESQSHRQEVISRKSQRSLLDVNSPYDFNSGAKLIVRQGVSTEAKDKDLLKEYFNSSDYDVKDLNVSKDGRYLVFAAHGPYGHASDNSWNIYEYDFQEMHLRRVIQDNTLANLGQDTNPTYADNGVIIFSSDRAAGNEQTRIDTLELALQGCYRVSESENPSLLHSMPLTGETITQLTSGFNHDTKPTTLSDGRIAFIRWSRSYEVLENCTIAFSKASDIGDNSVDGNDADNYRYLDVNVEAKGLSKPMSWGEDQRCAYAQSTPLGPVLASNHYTLLSISADGSQLQQLYDTVSIEASDVEFLQIDKIVQGSNGRLVALIRHAYNDFGGGDLLELQNPDISDQDAKNKVFGKLAPESLTDGPINLYPGQISEHGWYSAFWPYRDGSERMLISWSQCTTEEGGVDRFCDAMNDSNDVDTQYGIWVYDPKEDSRLPIVRAQSNTVYTELALAFANQSIELPYNAFNSEYVAPSGETGRKICLDPSPVISPAPSAIETLVSQDQAQVNTLSAAQPTMALVPDVLISTTGPSTIVTTTMTSPTIVLPTILPVSDLTASPTVSAQSQVAVASEDQPTSASAKQPSLQSAPAYVSTTESTTETSAELAEESTSVESTVTEPATSDPTTSEPTTTESRPVPSQPTVCVSPEAIVKSNDLVLSGTLRDFNDSHPDFESVVDGLDTRAVKFNLGVDGKPVYNPSRAGSAFHGESAFNQWYNDIDGVNAATNYSIVLDNTITADANVYTFTSNSFFPLDGLLFGNQGRSHNYHFTFELHSHFTYNGGESFSFSGDDDVWAYIDGKLVVDIGGVHAALSSSVDLDDLGLVVGESYAFDFFFAERHTSESNFRIDTGIHFDPPPVCAEETVAEINQAPIANAGSDQLVSGLSLVQLDSSISSDSDGLLSDYQWTQISGASVEILDADQSSASFITPEVQVCEDLVFSLQVTDDQQATAVDTITITILSSEEVIAFDDQGGSGDCKPGYGYGDKNHCHSGPKGLD